MKFSGIRLQELPDKVKYVCIRADGKQYVCIRVDRKQYVCIRADGKQYENSPCNN